MEHITKHIKIYGEVQGIGYRYFVRETAKSYGITGWVKNNIDGSVEIEASGSLETMKEFIEDIKTKHKWARIVKIIDEEIPYKKYTDFKIVF